MGGCDRHIHTTMYEIDKQGPTVYTGNYTQYSVITYEGKESGKDYI